MLFQYVFIRSSMHHRFYTCFGGNNKAASCGTIVIKPLTPGSIVLITLRHNSLGTLQLRTETTLQQEICKELQFFAILTLRVEATNHNQLTSFIYHDMISSHNYFLDQSISQYWSISSVLCFLVVGYQWFCRQYVMEQYLMSSPSFD